jgi:hypothetical protein
MAGSYTSQKISRDCYIEGSIAIAGSMDVTPGSSDWRHGGPRGSSRTVRAIIEETVLPTTSGEGEKKDHRVR